MHNILQMDPKNTRKGKEKNQGKDKGDYKYGNKRVRQYEALQSKQKTKEEQKKK